MVSPSFAQAGVRGFLLDQWPSLRARVSLLRDHNLTPSKDTRDCKGTSENAASRGSTGTFAASEARRVSLLLADWGLLQTFKTL